MGYDSETDLMNPTGSVFCAHGSGYLVNWDTVYDHMHLPLRETGRAAQETSAEVSKTHQEERHIGTDEIDAILNKTFYANQRRKELSQTFIPKKTREVVHIPTPRTMKKPTSDEAYLLVDGYNIIFGCEALHILAEQTIELAKDRLLDLLCSYQAYNKEHVMVVFDAYRVEGHPTEIYDYHNIKVVYTKEAETADQYIEKFAHEHASKYKITVATSDGTEQIITRGKGCLLLSATELYDEIERVHKRYWEDYKGKQEVDRHYLVDVLSDDMVRHIERIQKDTFS